MAKGRATHKNQMAVALGKLGAGVPKNYSTKERNRRRLLLALARKKRWVRLKQRN